MIRTKPQCSAWIFFSPSPLFFFLSCPFQPWGQACSCTHSHIPNKSHFAFPAHFSPELLHSQPRWHHVNSSGLNRFCHISPIITNGHFILPDAQEWSFGTIPDSFLSLRISVNAVSSAFYIHPESSHPPMASLQLASQLSHLLHSIFKTSVAEIRLQSQDILSS